MPAVSRATHDKASRQRWNAPAGSALALRISEAARAHDGPVIVVTRDMLEATRLQEELGFFAGTADDSLAFPDWETLPYDVFSPHQDIVSERLATLYRLPTLDTGTIVIPVATLMQRIAPPEFVAQHALVLETGQTLDLEALAERLERAGYNRVAQVMEHGEFAVRGSLIDLFPMGNAAPFRIDLFDDEVDSIRTFDPDSQRTVDRVDRISLLPAREFPTDEAGITRFRKQFRSAFDGRTDTTIYRDVSEGRMPPGIEFYLPLFFEQTGTLFDHLPADALVVELPGIDAAAQAFWNEVEERFEQRRHDRERPLLDPAALYLDPGRLDADLGARSGIEIHPREAEGDSDDALPAVAMASAAREPAARLQAFIDSFPGRVLLVAESRGRREALAEQLAETGLRPRPVDDWAAFLGDDAPLALTVGPLETGFRREDIAVVTEGDLAGERVRQRRRGNRRPGRDPAAIVNDLTELDEGAPVVHEDHGVGRYRGLQTLDIGGVATEFLTLEYAGGDKLYVPVSSLHLISRYTGTGDEGAPLHKLGSDKWEKAKRRAREKIHDVAAELLDIQARRAAARGQSCAVAADDYARFAADFPFEETPDQQATIDAVLADMASPQPMDRVVCGDVGFGKTEVAMRAAFAAVNGGRQVAVLVPTTLLAQQHYRNFADRFADWPVRVEMLSRFSGSKRVEQTLADITEGRVDIVIGTHKLLGNRMKFGNLGLVIVDEEQRFGVRHKEKLKAMRAAVDMLTLTATPIPRTLNMSLSGIRDLSIIATPPAERHAVKTFVGEWDAGLIREACLRELKRGGQVYFLHNEVKTIERMARQVEEIVPEARVGVAHGQMPERELEAVMSDFYHRRHNLLVCTTIVESGIDVPTANTILINRADKLGLAQLHQLRGRVGRSHHRAYAYLLTPPRAVMTADAVKRLEAIGSLEDLGVGFALATHDLEIRGAGDLLGEGQSGQIHEIGFSLYTDLLERAVKTLKSGSDLDLDKPLEHGAEIDLRIPALIPEDYVADVHTRLILYKRIANAPDKAALDELRVEFIDRFGLLPDALKNLFAVTELKLRANPLGVVKIDCGDRDGRIVFSEKPAVEPMRIIELIQRWPETYRFNGSDTLRFAGDLEDAESRIETVAAVLERLEAGEAAA